MTTATELSPVDLIVVPLEPGSPDEGGLVTAASVLARWFDAPVQFLADDAESLPRVQALSVTLGVRTIPVPAVGSGSFVDEVLRVAGSRSPSLIVTVPDGTGLEIARRSPQPVYFVPAGAAGRLPAGPLVAELRGREGDSGVLALTAVWAQALELDVKLVVDGPGDGERVAPAALRRLAEMGIAADADRLEPGDEPAVLTAGRTRQATAIVLEPERLGDLDLVAGAHRAGVPVLVAAAEATKALEPRAFGLDREDASRIDALPEGMEVLGRAECEEQLNAVPIARLGYIDNGWPVVVPVNHRVHEGGIFIRSVPGGKLEAARSEEVVCLEVDSIDVATRTGTSVLVHGRIEQIVDPAVLREAWAHDPDSWVTSDQWRWLRLVPFAITGRRIVAPSEAEPPGQG